MTSVKSQIWGGQRGAVHFFWHAICVEIMGEGQIMALQYGTMAESGLCIFRHPRSSTVIRWKQQARADMHIRWCATTRCSKSSRGALAQPDTMETW